MLVQQAVKKINQILKDLEAATGCVVESISLNSIDVTSLHSVRQELETTVAVELKRLPGRQWSDV